MNLDELQSVQSRERQTDQLQQLRATFYEEAGQFVAQLREERDRAADRADDPFDSPEVNRLTDDIKTAEQTVEAIYERRVGKIVKMASLAAADMPTEDDGLTQEEADLFETMVDAIKNNRTHVLDVIAGEAPTGAVGDGQSTGDAASTSPSASPESDPTPPTEPNNESEPTVDAADLMGGGTEETDPTSGSADPTGTGTDTSRSEPTATSEDRPTEEASAAVGADGARGVEGSADPQERPPQQDTEEPGRESDDEIDRQTVRITDDVGPIFGVDEREYDLSTDDVVTLPKDNAAPLVENDAAEPLE